MRLHPTPTLFDAVDYPDATWKIIPELGASIVFERSGSIPGFLLLFSSKPEMQRFDCEEDRKGLADKRGVVSSHRYNGTAPRKHR